MVICCEEEEEALVSALPRPGPRTAPNELFEFLQLSAPAGGFNQALHHYLKTCTLRPPAGSEPYTVIKLLVSRGWKDK